MSTTSKVAVIGLGNIGTVVAKNFVKGKRAVIVSDRTIEKAHTLARELGQLATPLSIAEAIETADVIVLAVWFSSIKDLFSQNTTALEGKIIIDPSNPIAPDETGGFKKIIDEKESAGETLAALLPKNAVLVKAFGTLGAASLANASFQQPANVLFYATDDTSVNETIESLITASGFDAIRVGGIDQSIRIEVFGDLHEFGALGKTVTIVEAEEKL